MPLYFNGRIIVLHTINQGSIPCGGTVALEQMKVRYFLNGFRRYLKHRSKVQTSTNWGDYIGQVRKLGQVQWLSGYCGCSIQ